MPRRVRTTLVVLAASAALGLPAVSGLSAPDAALLECGGLPSSEDAPDWAGQLTPERETTHTVEQVQVPSADGTLVSVKVYRPDAFDGPLPAVLIMSPYHSALGTYGQDFEDSDTVVDWADCMTPFLLSRGYVVALGDMRGTRNTDGCFDFGGPGDQADGYAVVEWLGTRPWANGNVGMYGVSHVGMSQYAAAVASPPHLKAIIPIAPITSFWRYLYMGGAHYELNMFTPAAYEYGTGAPPPTNASAPNYATNVAGSACGTYGVANGMLLDGTMTEYWKQRDYPSMADRIDAAVFHVHGTLDDNVKTDHFTTIWDALEANDVPRKALIGPWAHSEPAVEHWRLTALRWYEHWLRGIDTGIMDEPPVTAIDSDVEERHLADFPPPDAQRKEFALAAGALSDPRGAVTRGVATYQDVHGLRRERLRDSQGARLIYTGEPLQEPVRISGVPVVEVVAGISTPSTKFSAHLYDVDENGRAVLITRGYLDTHQRNGLDRSEVVAAGAVERFRVELHAREYVVWEGHRLEVILSSSDSCPYLSVTCGGTGIVSDTQMARVDVHEGRGLTRLVLPSPPVVRPA